jgi:hypothetical protein
LRYVYGFHSGEKHFCPPSQTFVLRGVTIRNALEMLFIKKVDEKHFVLFASTLTPSIVHDEHGSRRRPERNEAGRHSTLPVPNTRL